MKIRVKSREAKKVMARVTVKNLAGKKVEDLKLDPKVFEVEINEPLVKDVYNAIHANKRTNQAHTKTRSERTGSTAKPWKQKGTGRARTGSVKNPIWRKGGVTFGPRSNRNYSKKVNKKVSVQAMKMTLTGKLRDKEIVVVEKFDLKEKKTKEMARAIDKLKIDRKVLIVFGEKEKDLRKYSRNIEGASNITLENLNIFDMLNRKFLLMSKDSVMELEKKYGGQKVVQSVK